jgi:hypothetical protein
MLSYKEIYFMNAKIRTALVCFAFVLAARVSLAAEAPSLLAKPDKLLFEDDFARETMKPKWNVGKGDWSVKDGVVTAAERPEDKHAAYSYITPNVDYKDAIAEFSFKIDTAKNVQMNIRDSKYKESHAGHIARIQFEATKVMVADWKTGVMANENYSVTSDPKADPAAKKAINAKIKDKSATFKAISTVSDWHRARVEVVGDEMLVSVDGKPVAYLKSEGLDHATKNMLGITVGGRSAEVKDIKFWSATANPEWSKTRDAVLATLSK